MSPAPLEGRVVALSGSDSSLASGLMRGLRDLGATVGALDAVGPLDVAVHVPAEADLDAAPLHEIDEASWDRDCEAVLRAALSFAQAAFARMQGGGRVVFVTPTVGMTGAAGLVPFAAAVEGVRSLAKSAARQWGSHGITVNCVAPRIEHSPVVAAPALGGVPEVEDIASVIAFLGSDLASSVTGATIVVDGGIVMAP